MGRIYLRNELLRDARVWNMSQALGVSREIILGYCAALWIYADEQAALGHGPHCGCPVDVPGEPDNCPDPIGLLRHVTAEMVDDLVHHSGFAAAMLAVDWLIVTPEGVTIPRYGKYCSQRRDLSGALRQAIMKRDGHRCVNCGCSDQLEIDHRRPVSRGGKNTPGNLQVLCGPCNRRKGSSYEPTPTTH